MEDNIIENNIYKKVFEVICDFRLLPQFNYDELMQIAQPIAISTYAHNGLYQEMKLQEEIFELLANIQRYKCDHIIKFNIDRRKQLQDNYMEENIDILICATANYARSDKQERPGMDLQISMVADLLTHDIKMKVPLPKLLGWVNSNISIFDDYVVRHMVVTKLQKLSKAIGFDWNFVLKQ